MQITENSFEYNEWRIRRLYIGNNEQFITQIQRNIWNITGNPWEQTAI
jgi:hypothetical protein